MTSIQKTVIGSLLSLGVFTLCFALFSTLVAKHSLSTIDGTLKVKGVAMPMEITRNEYGIPHIVAQNDHDMWFGIGYAHAQDRLWQMDFTRRAGRGMLSEIFGVRTLQYDMFLRTLRLSVIVETLWKELSSESKAALTAYSQGINAFIAQSDNLPFEFEALGYAPTEWTPQDCLIIMRMMAWELNLSFWSDAAFGALTQQIGSERAQELIPGYPDTAPTILQSNTPNTTGADSGVVQQAAATRIGKIQTHSQLSSIYHNIVHELSSVRSFLGINGTAIGSNSWVHTSKDGGAILANDPHLTLGLPARWYQAHLSSPSANIIGLTIPGLPFVVIGRNDNIAWGITNMMADDCDYFIEKLDSAQRNYLRPDGTWQKVRLLRDTIRVKDSLPAIIDYRMTERSVIVSDYHLLRHGQDILSNGDADAITRPMFDTLALTFSWTGHLVSDEPRCFLQINKSKNFDDFVQATRFQKTPSLNFTYADKANNIGVALAGAIPIRSVGSPHGLFPRKGWEADHQWQGIRPADALPTQLNPPKKFIVTANNKPSRDLPFYISSLMEPPSRAQRITELLTQYYGYNVNQAIIMQTDAISPFARELMPRIINAIKASAGGIDPKSAEILALMEQWDFSIDPYQSQAMIFNKLYERIITNIFEDDLGNVSLGLYTFITNIPYRILMDFIAHPDKGAWWFDNKRTAAQETFEDICRRSFAETREQLTNDFGSDNPREWLYGKRHILTLRHPFGMRTESYGEKLISLVVNATNFAVVGDATTISCSQWDFRKPFEVSVGASTRFVCAMRDTVCYTILPGGSSGQPISANYTDQINLWRTGGYIKMPINRNQTSDVQHRLVLMPSTK